MTQTFRVRIITPSKTVLDKRVRKLFTKTQWGEIEFLPGHVFSIISTVPCITQICDENDVIQKLFTSKGIINIQNNELTFCCTASEFPEEVDFERAEKAKERADKRISNKEKYDIIRAQLALQRSVARLSLKK